VTGLFQTYSSYFRQPTNNTSYNWSPTTYQTDVVNWRYENRAAFRPAHYNYPAGGRVPTPPRAREVSRVETEFSDDVAWVTGND
jgi:hypothetical protein